jgi:hypothetical protein
VVLSRGAGPSNRPLEHRTIQVVTPTPMRCLPPDPLSAISNGVYPVEYLRPRQDQCHLGQPGTANEVT